MPFAIVFNQINVNSVSQTSAISTGQNSMADWSVQGKLNLAAGMQVGLVAITGNLNVIIDNDLVDTPVNSSELSNPQPTVQTKMAINMSFDAIQINYIHENSGIFIGSNRAYNWLTQKKINSAQGTVTGDGNLLLRNLNVINDSDLIDMPINAGNAANAQKQGQMS